MAVIEVEGLRKEYRRFRSPPTLAVNGLDLSVPEGGVFGFLGPNGSGKTTTIRCLFGLVHPTAGKTRVLGADSQSRELAGVIGRVGSMVETPMLYPNFSGRRNLMLLARVYGSGRSRVDDALGRVGLADRAGDRVKGYSLGMRQRLGLAAALLRDPEVLVLDEPANGLDPAGIKEIRELLRSLGDEGRTVFLSSHQLVEVEQICDQVAILARGKLIAAGAVRDVLSSGRAAGVVARLPAGDLEAGAAALRAAGIDVSVDRDVLRVSTTPEDAGRVTRVLARKRLYVSELRPDEVSLEQVFLELTSDSEAAVAPAPPPVSPPASAVEPS